MDTRHSMLWMSFFLQSAPGKPQLGALAGPWIDITLTVIKLLSWALLGLLVPGISGLLERK